MPALEQFTEHARWDIDSLTSSTIDLLGVMRLGFAQFGSRYWKVPHREELKAFFTRGPHQPVRFSLDLHTLSVYPPGVPRKYDPQPEEGRVVWVQPRPRLKFDEILPPGVPDDPDDTEIIPLWKNSVEEIGRFRNQRLEMLALIKGTYEELDVDIRNGVVAFSPDWYADISLVEGVPPLGQLVREWQ